MKILSIDVGTRNLGVCILGVTLAPLAPLNAPTFSILHWEVIDLHASTSSVATRSCVGAFWSRPAFYDVDVVLIESQDRAVSKMRRLSNAIESHFETVRVVLGKTYRIDWSSGDVKLRAY